MLVPKNTRSCEFEPQQYSLYTIEYEIRSNTRPIVILWVLCATQLKRNRCMGTSRIDLFDGPSTTTDILIACVVS